MDSSSKTNDILYDASPVFRLYKDGRFERLQMFEFVPPSLDPQTGVESKDTKLHLENTAETGTEEGLSVRLFKPKLLQNSKKIPLLLYFHGGGFWSHSTFSPIYHNYLNNLASQAQIIIVSVEYRLIPEHPFPIAFDDCWFALNWALSHDTEPWLVDHVDYSRIFLAGDSSGANIAHQMAMRVGLQGLAGGSINRITGIIMFHPFFWGKALIGNEVSKLDSELAGLELVKDLWPRIFQGSTGMDDSWINPGKDPNLSRLGCEEVLIFVSEEDVLRDRGFYYKEVLEKSGWQGKAEVVESKGEGHVFHLRKPSSVNAVDVMSKVAAFIKHAGVGFERVSRSRL